MSALMWVVVTMAVTIGMPDPALARAAVPGGHPGRNAGAASGKAPGPTLRPAVGPAITRQVGVSAAEPPATVVIRVYGGDLAADVLAPALAVASQILHEAVIEPAWPTCSRPKTDDTGAGGPATADAGFVCAHPIRSNELAVRLLRGVTAPAARGRLSLGSSLIDREQHGGALATVFLDRVEWLAAASGVDEVTLLGRAVAHEIGHLLLGRSDHGRGGLMRAIWSADALQQEGAVGWRFTAQEAALMRRALLRRAPVPLLALARE